MFFSKAARTLAIMAFVVGLLVLLAGLGAELGFLDPTAKPLFASRTPGQEIIWGLYTMLVAVVLGMLAEISLSVRRLSE